MASYRATIESLDKRMAQKQEYEAKERERIDVHPRRKLVRRKYQLAVNFDFCKHRAISQMVSCLFFFEFPVD